MPDSYAAKLDRLVAGTLAPEDFKHRDHIGVAYEALARNDFFEAAAQVAAGIRSLAARAGQAEKFNATITWAFLSLIAERMGTSARGDAADFIARNPDLVDGALLARLYSRPRLSSDLARSVALLPDRAPADPA